MPSPIKLRHERIKNELLELETIRCSAINWTTTKQIPDKVNIVFNIRSIVGLSTSGSPVYLDRHEVSIDLPSGYPLVSPIAKMARGYKPLFHPNFWTSGLICTQHNRWSPSENLSLFIIRLARMFQFDAIMTDPENPANTSAASWYKSMLRSGIFPTDIQELPLLIEEDDLDFKFTLMS